VQKYKQIQSLWSCASPEQRNDWAEDAKLVRGSAFGHHRIFPLWHEMSDEWKQKLSTVIGRGRLR